MPEQQNPQLNPKLIALVSGLVKYIEEIDSGTNTKNKNEAGENHESN